MTGMEGRDRDRHSGYGWLVNQIPNHNTPFYPSRFRDFRGSGVGWWRLRCVPEYFTTSVIKGRRRNPKISFVPYIRSFIHPSLPSLRILLLILSSYVAHSFMPSNIRVDSPPLSPSASIHQNLFPLHNNPPCTHATLRLMHLM